MSINIAETIQDYLKRIYPKSATKAEIFSALGVKGCCGDTSLDTLVVRRIVEVSGKKGRRNLYRYKKDSSRQK
jgi:hypothetical protein